MALLSQPEIDRALQELPDWTQDGNALTREVVASSFLAGIELVSAVAQVAEAQDHHPDIDIRYTTLTFRLATHSEGGLTEKDVRLAGEIDRLSA